MAKDISGIAMRVVVKLLEITLRKRCSITTTLSANQELCNNHSNSMVYGVHPIRFRVLTTLLEQSYCRHILRDMQLPTTTTPLAGWRTRTRRISPSAEVSATNSAHICQRHHLRTRWPDDAGAIRDEHGHLPQIAL